MTEQLWERRDCVSAQVDDALVLLDLETLEYHSLNATASAVWALLEQPRDEASLVAALCKQYDVSPEHCRESVHVLLQVLEAKKLVRPAAVVPSDSVDDLPAPKVPSVG